MPAIKEISQRVSSKIDVHCKDSFITLLKSYIKGDVEKCYGYCNDDGFTIWTYFPSQGLFFVIVKGKIVQQNNNTKIILSTKPNKIGLLLSLCFILPFFVITSAQVDFTLRGIFAVLLCTAIPSIVCRISYLYARKQTLAYFKPLLKV
jgi:hypothetical protein